MKRLFCGYLAVVFAFVFLCGPMDISAVDYNSSQIEEVATLFETLRESGKIIADENGYYIVLDNNYENHPYYGDVLIVVDHCNEAAAAGVIEISQTNDIQLRECAILDEEMLMDLRMNYITTINSMTIPANTEPGNSTYGMINVEQGIFDGGSGGSHTCSAMTIDLIGICEDNYQQLKSYYRSMLVVQMLNPSMNAYTLTVAYWVNLVRENGEWDYKSSSTYGPYNKPLCTYYDGQMHHFTSEYFGNFNYGYTGAFLFTLDILHTGSYAVSGFDPADQADWPAIDDGYYYKMG